MLFISALCFSQDVDRHKLRENFVSVKNEELRHCIYDYAYKLKEIENINDNVDDTEIFKLNNYPNCNYEVYLFTIPTHNSHANWGIAIKGKENNDIKLYSLNNDFPLAIYNLMEYNITNVCLYHFVYSIIEFIPAENIEWKQIKKNGDTYCYNINNWYDIYQKEKHNEFGIRRKKVCDLYNPIVRMNLPCIIPGESLKRKIISWQKATYGSGEIKYRLYKVTSQYPFYLLESKLPNGDTVLNTILCNEKEYLFFLTEDMFFSMVYYLPQYISVESDDFKQILKCMCLLYLYYYSGEK